MLLQGIGKKYSFVRLKFLFTFDYVILSLHLAINLLIYIILLQDISGEMVCDTPKDSLKVSLPKNDIPNKFWASVEPYVGEITENNIKVRIIAV